MSITCHGAVDKSSSKLAWQKCLKEGRVTASSGLLLSDRGADADKDWEMVGEGS